MSIRNVAIAVTAAIASTLAIAVPAALAHQTEARGGWAVTMHVNPDDEPIAGEASTIKVLKVRAPKGVAFSWARCACRISIVSASGDSVLNAPFKGSTSFTFPKSGAYEITISGRGSKAKQRKPFSVPFSIRAD